MKSNGIEIEPGKGLVGIVKFGDSLNFALSVLRENAALFGCIDIVVPRSSLEVSDRVDADADVWLVSSVSGLKLRFDKSTQCLMDIEIFLVDSGENRTRINYTLKGQSLQHFRPTVDEVQ